MRACPHLPTTGRAVTAPNSDRGPRPGISAYAPVRHVDGADEPNQSGKLIGKPNDGIPPVHRHPERLSTRSADRRFVVAGFDDKFAVELPAQPAPLDPKSDRGKFGCLAMTLELP